MADAKISQLPVATTPLAGTELVPVVQTATTKQTTVDAVIAAAAASSTVVASSDVGTAPNQIPLNQYLGTLAYQDATSVLVNALSATGDVVLGDTATDTVRVNGYMGVGAPPSTTFSLNVGSQALTGANQSGVYSAISGNSAATSGVFAFQGVPQTTNESFTCTAVAAFRAANAIKGAASTITNQYGLLVVDQTQGTNNFGVTSQVSSGANKWNIYASGTAANYFNGNVKIGGTADRATTAGTNHLSVFNGTAPVGTLSNGISIYSSAGEAYVMDAAGNATLFSPHDAETNEWIFKSKHTPTGKVLKIDVERLLRFVNDHFGLDAVQEFIEE